MPRAAWYFLKFANVSSSYGNNIAKSPWWYLKQQTVSLRKVFIKAFQRSPLRGGGKLLMKNNLWSHLDFFSSLFCLLHYSQRIAQDVVILFFKLLPYLIIQNISDQVASEGYKYSSSDNANLHLLPRYNGIHFFSFFFHFKCLLWVLRTKW